MNFPLPLTDLLGHWGSYSVYFIIGIAFGYVLENAGFGNSPKLAAQFYLKELTVFKVMFSAVVTAMILTFLATAIGILDFNLVFVPETYIWPGLLGGFIMGVGFVIGGFCPGTSLVASATFKVDGWFFVGGVLFGIVAFGETVQWYPSFFESSLLGRFTLDQLFGLPMGVIVIAVTVIALIAFVGAEWAETHFGGIAKTNHSGQWRKPIIATALALAALTLIIGQPTHEDRWNQIADAEQARIDNREIQINSEEVLDWMNDPLINVRLLDIRPEGDFNLFHIIESEHWRFDEITNPQNIAKLHLEPANTLFFIIGNNEQDALTVWKYLRAETVPNLYILEGGVNDWVKTFTDEEVANALYDANLAATGFGYQFKSALGDRQPGAYPIQHSDYAGELKVILELKRAAVSGGCG